MDTFTFLVMIFLMWMILQAGQAWLVWVIAAIMVVTMRSVSGTVMVLGVVGVLYYLTTEGLTELIPFAVLGLVIVALALGIGGKQEQPEYYSPDMGGYEGMFGGGGEGGY